MPEVSKPTNTTWWVVRNADASVLHEGRTEPNQVTSTGQPILATAENESKQLELLAAYKSKFPDLPAIGERLEVNAIYKHNDELYMVRQSHNRTEHDPTTVPALFLWHRADDSSVDWIAGESVVVGTVRSYLGQNYRCIQAHVTQSDWQPPNVPALWEVVQVVPDIPDWVQPTGAHDAYPLAARVRYNGQVWESTIAANVWAPGTGALWVVIT